ncbi:uncharacterized protein BDZ99DRAFT_565358 [Mytilinidion resinicola]|uniref:Uncharacterized protein n=1 Tax=Mytilinidion resinicola TaxID=574789 RepID=A0A6A6ZA86_9PEZI|nr:uncharacterized protein BDZ99DRAFT_565358 [Mytilinidion resinicola]KAF2817643.1 hypothetical protein BDZ99DRAFT_565358 [Mytilinidion resinicola]
MSLDHYWDVYGTLTEGYQKRRRELKIQGASDESQSEERPSHSSEASSGSSYINLVNSPSKIPKLHLQAPDGKKKVLAGEDIDNHAQAISSNPSGSQEPTLKQSDETIIEVIRDPVIEEERSTLKTERGRRRSEDSTETKEGIENS